MTTVENLLNLNLKSSKGLSKELCCKLEAIIDLLNGTTPPATGGVGTSCTTPSFTKLCELQQILDALNAIKIQINGDDIAINMNLNDLELLTTQLNTTQTLALTTLNSILTQVTRGVSCGNPQFVEICNQLDISGLQSTLNSINANTDQLEQLIAANTLSTSTKIEELRIQLTQPNTNHVIVDNFIPDPTLDTFQILDCQGLPVGPIQDIKKVVVLNKQISYICNVQELATAINANVTPQVLYNNVKQQETILTPIIIPANTVHSISYKILEGKVDVTIGSDTLTYEINESDSEEATSKIIQQYTFTPQIGGKVKIKTIF